MELLSPYKFIKLNLTAQSRHLLDVKNYLDRFPACKYGSKEYNRACNLLNSSDYCRHHILSIYKTFKILLMKTPTKKKAVMKEYKKNKKLFDSVFPVKHSIYELYRTRSGAWKFRKRAKNGEILNHSYNSKALAIKGMEADFRLTKEMSELKWKEIKK